MCVMIICVIEINFLTRESESSYKQPLRLCMRNKILRSANDKYHYSYLLFFFNKGDLPLMYSCVFWCKFIDQIGFFGCYCLTPVTLFIIRVKGITEKQPAVQTVSTRRQFAARKPIQSQIFSTRGELLSSLQRIKRLETKYPHACC